MGLIRILLLSVLFVVATGCAEFQFPLTDLKNAAADPALNGIWLVDDMTSLYIAKKSDREHAVVIINKAMGSGLNVNELSAFPVKLGGKRYLNVSFPGKTIEKAWAFFRYRVHNSTLELALIDHNYLREVVTAKQLKGFIKDTKCEFFIDPARYSKEYKNVGQAMGVLALNSLMRTMCRERMQIPVVTANSDRISSFFSDASTQARFVSLESPHQVVAW